MSKLPIISSKDMARILESIGFSEVRQKGSHKVYSHRDGRTVVVPSHRDDLGRGLIRTLLREIEITVDDYIKLKKNR